MMFRSVLQKGVARAVAMPAACRHGSSSSSSAAAVTSAKNYDSVDGGFEKYRVVRKAGEANSRDFTYLLLGFNRMYYASAARITLARFVASMSASSDVLSVASAEYNIGNVPLGTCLTVKWRGKPVFVRHRTDKEIATEGAVDISKLPDPESDVDRARDPKFLIVIGVCTHLGCIPLPYSGDYNGWFCPCHGSHYDASGRIRKGPAPLNLPVPPYVMDGDVITIG